MKRSTVQLGPKVLDINDAAHYLAMSVGTFRSQVLPHIRQISLSERRKGYLVSELDRWLDSKLSHSDIHAPHDGFNPWDALT